MAMKRKIIVFAAVVLLLSFPIAAFGAKTVDKIEAYLANDIKFKVDGESWQPKNVDGTLLYPIIFNGRSYVPVRSLLENKGVKVDFDDSERTIILNYSGNGGWDVSKIEAFDNSGNGGWDVSKLTKDDLNSSTLMDVWDVKDNSKIKIINFTEKPSDEQEIHFANVSKFILSNDAKVSIDGKTYSINDIVKGLSNGDIEVVEYKHGDSVKYKLKNSDKIEIHYINKEIVGISASLISNIILEYNKEKGQVIGIDIKSVQRDEDGKFNLLDAHIGFEESERRSVSIIQRERDIE